MNTTTERKQIDWLKFINTFILSVIAIFTIISFNMLATIQKENTTTKIELVRLKTIQDENTNKITVLTSRVNILENENANALKQWVDDNYVRKPQK
jgi:hypothetical protein